MATIPYDEPITKNTDWGGDSTTGGRPVAGGRVQDFIKGSLQDLDDRIKNISGLGRFLSGWDCTTGLAVTNPSGSTYEYPDGAFYIVAKVGAKNYRPSGSKYVVGTASKVVETGSVKVGDVYKYDGSAWLLINLDTQEIPAFSNETAGTIRGKAQDGFVSAEDGYGKVQGWQDATQETRGLMTADDKTKLDGVEEWANKTEVDASLNATSENPVQNKAIAEALNKKVDSSNGRLVTPFILPVATVLDGSGLAQGYLGTAVSVPNSLGLFIAPDYDQDPSQFIGLIKNGGIVTGHIMCDEVVLQGTNNGEHLSANPSSASNDTQIATTSWVNDKLTPKANLASPTFTGTPKSTTPTSTDNSTRIATTAYVKSNLANYVSTSDSRLTDSRTPSGSAGGDLSGTYPNPSIKSSVALTGSPTAPTPAASTNSTRIATTAYVKNNLNTKADIDSPAFTGTPTAPTPDISDVSGKIATTEFLSKIKQKEESFTSGQDTGTWSRHNEWILITPTAASPNCTITADTTLPAAGNTRAANVLNIIYRAPASTSTITVSVGGISSTLTLTGMTATAMYTIQIICLSYSQSSKYFYKTVIKNA